MTIRILTVILFIFTFNHVFAQGDQYIFKSLRIEDGLSQSSIICLTQDRQGYIWFGTGDGLNRYDGYKIKVFRNSFSKTSTISSNTITSLFINNNGLLLAGVLTGELNIFDHNNNSFKFIDLKKFTPSMLKNLVIPVPNYPMTNFSRTDNSSISSMTEDNLGNLWAGTWGIGLYKLKNNSGNYSFVKVIDSANKIPLIKITKIISSGNYIWVSTLGNGLFRVDIKTESITHLSTKSLSSPLLSDEILTIILSSKNKLYISYYLRGMQVLDLDKSGLTPISIPIFHKKIDKPLNNVMSIVQDKEKNIWFGTFGYGLFRIYDDDFNTIVNFSHRPFDMESLSSDEIMTLLVDQNNILWIGNHLSKGALRLIKGNKKFNIITKERFGDLNLNDDIVWSIYEDKNSILYVGTFRGGLSIIDRNKKTVKYLKKENSKLSCNHIRSITEDPFGNLWIGTFSGGLNILNKKTGNITVYTHNPRNPSSISSNQVLKIIFSEDSTAWISTYGGGLNKCKLNSQASINNLTFKSYQNEVGKNSISDNRVYTITQLNTGELLLGTFGGGLNVFDPKSEIFSIYKNIPNDQTSISDNRILAITQSSLGEIWIGTFGGNLNKFDFRTKKFNRLGRENGFNTSVIYGILEDKLGNLWLSSDNGILKYNHSTDRISYYDISDGLQSMEFSGGSLFKNSKGILFFGGIAGLNYFYPSDIKENKLIPPIAITSVKIFGEEINYSNNTIFLEYDQNYLTFEFSALDYTNPGKSKYKFKLDNFNDKWILTDAKNRIATFTNLSPGTYTFRVTGTNNDGYWNEKGAYVNIVISSPFWLRWWFIALLIFALVLLIITFISLRFQNILAVERLKTKLAADLHDSVGSSLTEISILSELVVAQFPEADKNIVTKLNKISDTARSLIDNMSDIVWVVNPQKDSIHDLIVRLRDSYSDIYSYKGISFTTQNVDKIKEVKFAMEYKQNLYLILKEALNNSLKHSNCTKIMLDVNLTNSYLTVTLSDNGKGIDNSQISLGNGIKNMRSRAEFLGATLEWHSTINEGTLVVFKGKIGKKSNKSKI